MSMIHRRRISVPDCFYYSETQSKVKYGDTPSGAPNIDRLIAGQSAFPMPMPAREEKQKKLVLSHWIDVHKNPSRKAAYVNVLSELMTQGFTIYQVDGGNVIPFTIDDLKLVIRSDQMSGKSPNSRALSNGSTLAEHVSEDDYKDRLSRKFRRTQRTLNLLTTEAVQRAALKQQGIVESQMQILDDYWLDYLMSYAETPGPRVLRVSDIPELSETDKDKLAELLRSATPKLEKIIVDEELDWSTERGNLLIDMLGIEDISIEIPVAPINMKLASRNFSSTILSKILATSCQADSIKILDTSDAAQRKHENRIEPMLLDLANNSLPNLRSLSLGGYSSLQTLESILKAAPHLENLQLYASIENNCVLDISLLAHLKNLDMNLSNNISIENLNILLHAPSLAEASKKLIQDCINYKLKTENASSQITSTPKDPTHNPSEMRDFTPPSDTFKFTGKNKTKNQGMIIENLCQYLTMEGKHLAVIPKIQVGICLALSHYFKDTKKTAWDDFINRALAWNGKKDKLNEELITYFETLFPYVEQYYLRPQKQSIYLGDVFPSWLATIKEPVVLANPWHAITIKPISEGQWQVYDPNYTTGYREVSSDELLSTIHDAIGRLISIRTDQPVPPGKIADHNAFIEHGGLLVLQNHGNTQDLLNQLPSPQTILYSKTALDGLLLRGTSGKPAWLLCIESDNESLKHFVCGLLEQFKAMNADYVRQLQTSLDALTPAQAGECITKIVQFFEFDEGLISSIQASTNKKIYEQELKTWDKAAVMVNNPVEYVQHCLNGEKKRLIELGSTREVDALISALETQAHKISQPVFYIDNPEDLICSSPYVEKMQDNSGVLHKGPGGFLYDFLTANHDQAPLIIVNYERFHADDIVKFNSLLDKEPKADGTRLPPNTTIIGLMNRNKPDCYQGSDFYSRFDRTEICPLSAAQFSTLNPKRTIETSKQQQDEPVRIINLFHAANWKERLLGRWILDGDQYTYSEGELIQAICEGKSIEIQNGLWQDPDFQRFWQQALSGGVQHAGRRIQIPENLSIYQTEVDGYNREHLITPVMHMSAGLSSDLAATTLNPGCLLTFLERYEVEGKKLVKKPGLLQLALNNESPCIINVTRSLSEDEWALLLTEANRLGVRLSIHCAPNVTLPAIFGFNQSNHLNKTDGIPGDLKGNILIESTDPDTTIALLTQKSQLPLKVIDVSECTAADILLRVNVQLNDDNPPSFEFSQTDSAVTTGLRANQTMVLKGHFSPELLDALAPLILERERTHAGGNLVLVTQETEMSCVPNQFRHFVSPDDKRACLDGSKNISPLLLATESLSRLRARSAFLQRNPSENSDNAWLGMNNLPGKPTAGWMPELDKKRSAVESLMFTKQRLYDVNNILSTEPYVFLTGLSGVGKSTFVEQELCNENDALYLTEHRILDWVNDKSDKRKILFIDEANLNLSDWTQFNGLFNTPPSILVNGILHTLTPEHKVVFAGNPVQYGDERKLASFFKDHGAALLFTPLPPAVIYEKILKPIFLGMETELDKIIDQILDMYAFVCSCSESEILISPRELEMIALLTRLHVTQNPNLDVQAVAAHFIYQLAKNLVPPDRRNQFDEQFKPENQLVFPASASQQPSDFLITESRQAVSQQLDDLLNLRELRRDQESILNDKQKFGGLGGIIIEGEPGIGKSELVIASLIDRGYQEEHDFQTPSHKPNPFYRMPVSMSLTEKENLLCKAFDEGAVVMIDEINSSPMMERLLNDLLMGKNPRNENATPKKPGFMIIGTQNPITMAGRRAPSTALKRRLITTELPEYKPDEMIEILVKKGVAPAQAVVMMEAYEQKRQQAIKENLKPVPNFRNLMTLVDNHLKAIQKQKTKDSNDIKDVEDKTSQIQIILKAKNFMQFALKQAQELKENHDTDGMVDLLVKCVRIKKSLNQLDVFTNGSPDDLYPQFDELYNQLKAIFRQMKKDNGPHSSCTVS